uniref:Poly(A) RNA polymerase, mitochondrial n=1 Tax=Cacopsylla melanoneura TaxID=428564 RepID=A0A8D8LWM5_9HEMI
MWSLKRACFKALCDPCVSISCKYLVPSPSKYSFKCVMLGSSAACQLRSASSTKRTFVPFDNIIQERRLEAQRSILVQVQSEKSCHDLFSFASQFGTVESMLHYSVPGENHFVIVEMKDSQVTQKMLTKCGHLDKSQVVPVRSPFLWFRASKNKSKLENEKEHVKINCDSHNIFPPSEEELTEQLIGCHTIAHQMTTLYQITKMNEINTRLRFLVAYQVERALAGLFPLCAIYPFGSSVNYFGKLGCDLDLVLQLDMQSKEDSDDCRLMFHCKSSLGSERSQTLRHLETVGDLLQLFLPGCSQVKRILGARVPIIKYNHDMTALECDLSMTNLTALYMAELLYVFGEIDWRVRTLVFTIKKWAKDINLTNPTPGRWITNFSLTILILFYLQSVKVLPSMKLLVDSASPKDRRVSDDGVNCTFLRDISKLQFHPSLPDTTDSLSTLLFGFFEFYSQFDFNNQGVSLYYGSPIPKPEYSALYINNPLERGLNVSKNVSFEELERLKVELRNASWKLESTANNNNKTHTPLESWGILELFKKQNLGEKAKNVFFTEGMKTKERLVSVQDLFSEGSNEDSQSIPVEPDYKKRKPVSAQTLKAVQKAMKTKRR